MVNSVLLSAKSALYSRILNNNCNVKSDTTRQNYKLMWSVLDGHAKTIAYNKSVAKMLGRDKTKKDAVVEQHRIALPWKCQHGYITKQQDQYFLGTNVVTHEDRVKFMHIELMEFQTDGYSPMKIAAADSNTVLSNSCEEDELYCQPH
jgi:hypothetical protein